MANAPITNTAVSGMLRSRAGITSAVPPRADKWARRSASTRRPLAGTGPSLLIAPGVRGGNARLLWVSAGLGIAIIGLGVVSTTARAAKARSRVALSLE